MIVRIDPDAPVPPYEQLRAQVAALIVSGSLAVGHRLPPIRQLAADLGLAPGTVARAYRELEAAGLVRSQGRRGTRVQAREQHRGTPDHGEVLAAAAKRFAIEVAELDLDVEEAVGAVRAALATTVQGAR